MGSEHSSLYIKKDLKLIVAEPVISDEAKLEFLTAYSNLLLDYTKMTETLSQYIVKHKQDK